MIPIDQLKEFIEGTIKNKYEVAVKSSLTYAKPYTARVDTLKMPAGYQPPKFQQFNGKSNPKQHIAHFVETCNNARTYGDYLIKQFVRSLKGNAFDWYTDLEARSIDSWDQLEQEFLNRFYNTRRTVSMIELTNTRQRKGEPVIDFINRWRNTSLNYKDRLSEASGIEMCIQELMIDATTGYEAMSFMDGSSGYNQICMAPKDEELPAFRTPKGIYCYKVMPFGLKNAGATYQRAMHNIDDLLHKNVECYVDDLVLKHYFQDHVVRLVSRANPIKFVMSKPVLSDRLARWYLQFQQFEIVYIPQKAIKGQALADFLADHLIPDDWKLADELHDEDAMAVEVQPPWKMYFDAAAHRGGAGASVVFVTPQVPPPNEAEGEENELKHLVSIFEVEKEEWRQPIIDYLCYGILPENSRKRTEIRRRAPRFLHYKDTLYRRLFEGVLLRFLGEEEALQALQEAHSRPFDAWGLDVVGPLPKSSGGHLYILAATDYFSKWAEVVALKEVKKENVANNGKPFDNRLMNKICELFGFKQHNSSMYNADANGLAEAFNKTICNLLKKVVYKSKRDWNERMEEALWGSSLQNGMGHMSYKKLTQVRLTSWLMQMIFNEADWEARFRCGNSLNQLLKRTGIAKAAVQLYGIYLVNSNFNITWLFFKFK
ncbi:uncharacterized protein [Nicotiana sylvestris]|uniref:uncharacterized protein n=1 Tax=Nicotiana sylvestris TaxID=4096 RepID=UPI00388C8188